MNYGDGSNIEMFEKGLEQSLVVSKSGKQKTISIHNIYSNPGKYSVE